MNNELQKIFSYLQSNNFHASREWIEGCVDYFREQHEGSTYSYSQIQEFVTQQWKLADLREISHGCLPPNLSQQKKVNLTGKYSVQVESMCDIAKSFYSQLQTIRKVPLENVKATEKNKESWEPSEKRVLQLMLCDGVQDIKAIEYKPIRALDQQIVPGFKVLIIGPVDCRRGVILLKEENLKIIGGEVDSLLIPNALENVLARALQLEENPDPYNTEAISDQRISLPSVEQSRNALRPLEQQFLDAADDDIFSLEVDAQLKELEEKQVELQNKMPSSVAKEDDFEEAYRTELEMMDVDCDIDSLENQSLFDIVNEPTLSRSSAKPAEPTVSKSTVRPSEPTVSRSAVRPPEPTVSRSAGTSEPTVSRTTVRPKEPTASRSTVRPIEPTASRSTVRPLESTVSSSTARLPEPSVYRSTERPPREENKISERTFAQPEQVLLEDDDIFLEMSDSDFQLNSATVPGVKEDSVTKRQGVRNQNISDLKEQEVIVLDDDDDDEPTDVWRKDIYDPPGRSDRSSIKPNRGNIPQSTKQNSLFAKKASLKAPMASTKNAIKSAGQPKISSFFAKEDFPLHEDKYQSLQNEHQQLVQSSSEVNLIGNTQGEKLVPLSNEPESTSIFDKCDFDEPVLIDNTETYFPLTSEIHTSNRSQYFVESSNSIMTDSRPFVYLQQIKDIRPTTGTLSYTVKAFVLTLTSVLKPKDDSWHLTAKICDGSALLEVQFSSDLLDNLIGLSLNEVKVLKKDIKKNPLIKERIRKALENAQQQLIDLNALVLVEFRTNDELPCIVEITEVTEEHVKLLRSRIKSTSTVTRK